MRSTFSSQHNASHPRSTAPPPPTLHPPRRGRIDESYGLLLVLLWFTELTLSGLRGHTVNGRTGGVRLTSETGRERSGLRPGWRLLPLWERRGIVTPINNATSSSHSRFSKTHPTRGRKSSPLCRSLVLKYGAGASCAVARREKFWVISFVDPNRTFLDYYFACVLILKSRRDSGGVLKLGPGEFFKLC